MDLVHKTLRLGYRQDEWDWADTIERDVQSFSKNGIFTLNKRKKINKHMYVFDL